MQILTLPVCLRTGSTGAHQSIGSVTSSIMPASKHAFELFFHFGKKQERNFPGGIYAIALCFTGELYVDWLTVH